ncbi:MAG: hypothetical protein AAFU59_00890 [Pseudomonadota bacterium]
MPEIPAGTLKLARTVNSLSSLSRIEPEARVAATATATAAVTPIVEPVIGDILAPEGPTPLVRVPFVRPDDLLAAQFVFHNLSLTPSKEQLIRTVPSRNAHICFELQGQHFGEETLFDGNPIPPSPTVMRARFAYPSRIVVLMPKTELSVPYTLDALLGAITNWPLSLDSLVRLPPVFIPGSVSFEALSVAETQNKVIEAAEALSEASLDLERGLEDEARAESILKRAKRSAGEAVSAMRVGSTGSNVTRDAAIALNAEMAADDGIDAEQMEVANALFEVSVGSTIAREIAVRPDLATNLSDSLVVELAPALFLSMSPHKPGNLVTSIELPYRIMQAPHKSATFAHPVSPVSLSGRTELWRTTLSRRTNTGPQPLTASGAPIIAMWSPDYNSSSVPTDPFSMSISGFQRRALVKLMSDHLAKQPGGADYVPSPARARRMQLSAWGGTLEADGAWPVRPAGVGVESWQHDASYGRDERVQIVEAGFLYPWGHRASLVTLTTRGVEDWNPNGCAATLRKIQFILIREVEKTFPATGQVHQGRKLPFQVINCLTRRTPRLRENVAAISKVGTLNGATQAFWPIDLVSGTPNLFEFEAADLGGHRTVFSAPAIFIHEPFLDQANPPMHQVHTGWAGSGSNINPRSRVDYGGQTVRMAPVGSGNPGDVDLPIDEIVFEGTPASGSVRPPYHPAVRCADAQLKALKGITGKVTSETVEYETSTYLPNGYTNNPWRVFLSLKSPYQVSMGADVPTDKVGGIAQPSQTLSAISNGQGAVSGSTSALTSGTVQPDDLFPDAKILGGFDLKDIIAPLVAVVADAIPGFKTERFPDRVETSWEFKRESVNSPIPGLVTGQGGDSELELTAKLTAYLVVDDPDLGFLDLEGDPRPDFGAGNDPGFKDPEVKATGKLTNFKLNFFGFVIVWFDEFGFESSLKNKFKPNPKLNDDAPVVFGGPLEFVNKLADLIPAGGFSDPPIIKPSFSDLKVGYDFKLPNVEVGIFALKNMKIGAYLTIPFKGDPVSLKFFFNTREAPFLLTVSMFGGGGFFALVTTAEGITEIEAAFEFGAFASFDVGVASGGVYVKAGVYFHWKQDAVTLEGYVEMGGELSVLGLISVSVTLHLSLGYYKADAKSFVKGQATIKIEVQVLFFSTTVKVTAERKFSGSDSDPTFAQLITDQSTWDRYCAAFA